MGKKSKVLETAIRKTTHVRGRIYGGQYTQSEIVALSKYGKVDEYQLLKARIGMKFGYGGLRSVYITVHDRYMDKFLK